MLCFMLQICLKLKTKLTPSFRFGVPTPIGQGDSMPIFFPEITPMFRIAHVLLLRNGLRIFFSEEILIFQNCAKPDKDTKLRRKKH